MSVNHTTQNSSETISASTIGFGLSYAITSILSALLVVLKESSETIHNVLAAITGHHWVTHGVLDIILFLVFGFIFSRVCNCSSITAKTLVMVIVGSTVISGLIITGYFL